MKRFLAALMCLTALFSARVGAQEAPVVQLFISDMRPFAWREDGQEVSGFLADYLRTAFANAGVEIAWNDAPWEAQQRVWTSGRPNMCSIAMYKTEDRKDLLVFSEPIGVTRSISIVTASDAEFVDGYADMKSLFADKSRKVLVEAGSSYGTRIDGLIAEHSVPSAEVSNDRLINLILAGRLDYAVFESDYIRMYQEREEYADLLAYHDHFPDLDRNIPYYLACSKTTPVAIMKKLNAAFVEQGLAVWSQSSE